VDEFRQFNDLTYGSNNALTPAFRRKNTALLDGYNHIVNCKTFAEPHAPYAEMLTVFIGIMRPIKYWKKLFKIPFHDLSSY